MGAPMGDSPATENLKGYATGTYFEHATDIPVLEMLVIHTSAYHGIVRYSSLEKRLGVALILLLYTALPKATCPP